MSDTKKQFRGGRPSKREFILKQAEILVRERGASQLTFDALTEQTGISKGGLLYHFESKEALIIAMLERYIGQRQERTAAVLEAKPYLLDAPDGELLAMVEAEITEPQEMLAVDSAIVAAVAANPELLEPVRQRNRELWERLDKAQAGAAQARVAWKAVVGHRLLKQFGLLIESDEQTEAFIAEVTAMLTPSAKNSSDDSVFG
ncbi:TetR/AcrR family transcriptional regulator [Aliidiomarina haloalkalitolerans]|uniref:TetR/AcrR family transcriptional regulator n=1 Tax=Aliidiomarina haloalkalitolerans TaxID=859059 RepID=A0A432VSS2_9GAMM|nr:TetR/AcrR family transcriptional regulator [Aliidiomarina haloalkalitolerans]RUO19455.1 TetR/AcrR family transcriptional regulator [Aliidiomarina haloalkalitolerans]